MTPREIIREFSGYSTAQQAALISKLSRTMQEKLESDHELNTQDERVAIIEQLAGALKTDSPPMTKEEVRDVITSYLMEKHS